MQRNLQHQANRKAKVTEESDTISNSIRSTMMQVRVTIMLQRKKVDIKATTREKKELRILTTMSMMLIR